MFIVLQYDFIFIYHIFFAMFRSLGGSWMRNFENKTQWRFWSDQFIYMSRPTKMIVITKSDSAKRTNYAFDGKNTVWRIGSKIGFCREICPCRSMLWLFFPFGLWLSENQTDGFHAMSHEHVSDHLTSIIRSIHVLKKTLDVTNQVTLEELTLLLSAATQYLCSLPQGSFTLRAMQAADAPILVCTLANSCHDIPAVITFTDLKN